MVIKSTKKVQRPPPIPTKRTGPTVVEVREQMAKDGIKLCTPIRAIREKCMDCSSQQKKEVRYCVCSSCSIWPYRMGHRPKIEQLEEWYAMSLRDDGGGTDEEDVENEDGIPVVETGDDLSDEETQDDDFGFEE